ERSLAGARESVGHGEPLRGRAETLAHPLPPIGDDLAKSIGLVHPGNGFTGQGRAPLERIACKAEHQRGAGKRPRRGGKAPQPHHPARGHERQERDPEPDHASSSPSPRRKRPKASHPPTPRNMSGPSQSSAVAPSKAGS